MTKVAIVTFRDVTLNTDNKKFDFNIETTMTDKEYTYLIPEGLDVKVGDYCLVNVRNTTKVSVVYIEKLVEEDIECKAYSYLLSKLDFSAALNKSKLIKQREVLERKINEAYKKASKIKILEEMGKTDPEIQKLVDEYKAIN